MWSKDFDCDHSNRAHLFRDFHPQSTRYLKSLSGTGYVLWKRLTAEVSGIEAKGLYKSRIRELIIQE